MTTMKRPATRGEVSLPVELTFGSGLRVMAECQNLSQTGMLVLSEDPKPPGTRLSFDCEDFRGQAVVIWAEESPLGRLLGLKFTALGKRDRAALVSILSSSVRYK